MGEVSAAFQSMRGSLLSMIASGMEFQQIVQVRNQINCRMRRGSTRREPKSSKRLPGGANQPAPALAPYHEPQGRNGER